MASRNHPVSQRPSGSGARSRDGCNQQSGWNETYVESDRPTLSYFSDAPTRTNSRSWAQVRAGYSMSTEEVTRKLCYDLYYIKHMSLTFDLQILVDTVKFVLSGKRPG